MAFKCHVCKKLYMNNVEFMKHLNLHVDTERAAVDTQEQELEQCKYCYKVIRRRGASGMNQDCADFDFCVLRCLILLGLWAEQFS